MRRFECGTAWSIHVFISGRILHHTPLNWRMASSLEILRPSFGASSWKTVAKERSATEKHLEELTFLSLKLINEKDWRNEFFSKHYSPDMTAEHSFGPRITMNNRDEWMSRLQELAEMYPQTTYTPLAAVAHVDITMKKSATVWSVYRTMGYPNFLCQITISHTVWREEEGVWWGIRKKVIRGGGSLINGHFAHLCSLP